MNRKDIKKEFLIRIAIIIGIIIAVNVISSRVFTRIDVTKNKSFTLSKISKDIVKGLGDKLVVKAYFSENLPPPYNNLRRQVQDLLSDYRSYSGGNLNYEFLNPTAEEQDNELAKDAQKYGITPVQIQAQENYKYEIKMAFLGLVLMYGGKQEVIPFIQPDNTGFDANLEYELTSLIRKLSLEKKKKVGFLAGHGEYDYSKFTEISKTLSAQYELVRVDVSKFTLVPDDVDVIIVMGPKSEFPESHKYILDQFLMRGGNIAWMINKVVPNFNQQQMVMGDQVKNNLDDMLGSYGVAIENNLVKDLQCAQIPRQTQYGFQILSEYPFFPRVTNINRDIPAFKNVAFVIMPFVSSLDLNASQNKGLTVKPLLTSSDKSGKQEGFFFLNLEQFDNIGKLDRRAIDTMFGHKGFVLGASYEGKFTSFYTGKPIPKDTAKDYPPPDSFPNLAVKRLNGSSKDARIVAIGDGDFGNEEQKMPKQNIEFFIDIIDYLADDIGLSEIRGKQTSEPVIEAPSDFSRKMFTFMNYLLPLAIVAVFGLYNWNKRKSRKKKLQSN
ncbi:hypothetical protein D4R20_00875 [bacterium]|nr:MAG: hypothetical protein D4R20_00875 [bacterium]